MDERAEAFPPTLPDNVTAVLSEDCEDEVDAAPAGAWFVVMTHEHGLDQRLAERILRRDDFSWFGLIGSHTKRRAFEQRLGARGIEAARLARMQCPIGGWHSRQAPGGDRRRSGGTDIAGARGARGARHGPCAAQRTGVIRAARCGSQDA